MRAFILSAAAVASLGLASPLPASAQQEQGPPTPTGPYNPALAPDDPAQNLPPEKRVSDWSIERRMQWTEQQLQQAEQSGRMDAGQLQRARAQIAGIREEQAKLKGWHGLYTKSDQAYLFRRLDQVDAKLGLGPLPWGV
jgi:hypothetical protein